VISSDTDDDKEEIKDYELISEKDDYDTKVQKATRLNTELKSFNADGNLPKSSKRILKGFYTANPKYLANQSDDDRD